MNTLMKTPTGPLVEARQHLEDALALDEIAGVHHQSASTAIKAKGSALATTTATAKGLMAEVQALRRENRELAEAVKLLVEAMAKGRGPENADALAGEIMRRLTGPAPGAKAATAAPPAEAAPLPDLSIVGTVGGASGGGGLLGLVTCDYVGCHSIGPWPESTSCSHHRSTTARQSVTGDFEVADRLAEIARASKDAKRAAARSAEAAARLERLGGEDGGPDKG